MHLERIELRLNLDAEGAVSYEGKPTSGVKFSLVILTYTKHTYSMFSSVVNTESWYAKAQAEHATKYCT